MRSFFVIFFAHANTAFWVFEWAKWCFGRPFVTLLLVLVKHLIVQMVASRPSWPIFVNNYNLRTNRLLHCIWVASIVR
jgi:hypothetical protein